MRAAAIIALTRSSNAGTAAAIRAGFPARRSRSYGRIVGLVDTFDAVFSDRAYRKAMSEDKGLGIITSQRGHHFDPRLVDIFLENLPTFTAIIDQYRDAVPAATPRPRTMIRSP